MPPPRRVVRWFAVALVLALVASACGTKGALFLPKPDTDDAPKRRAS